MPHYKCNKHKSIKLIGKRRTIKYFLDNRIKYFKALMDPFILTNWTLLNKIGDLS